ncbi:MAG TPA: c-type cytochrome [Acidiferrobacterales bacterium]|nr:c-type cytochrome [Acidiferrobacterales bacterium]
MKKLISLVVLMVCVGAAGSAVAAGSVAAGKTKSAACAACHGVDGNSAAPNFPKLAGLDAQYIAKQLADYKSGARKDPLMIGMVAGLSRKDMDDLGAYYASRKRSTGTTGASADVLKKAERLYRGGDAKNGISACISCHGPAGTGIPPRFPAVSGQHAAYSQKQLLDFKTGTRSNDGEIMTRIAFRLSEAEIKAVSEYMAGLR